VNPDRTSPFVFVIPSNDIGERMKQKRSVHHRPSRIRFAFGTGIATLRSFPTSLVAVHAFGVDAFVR